MESFSIIVYVILFDLYNFRWLSCFKPFEKKYSTETEKYHRISQYKFSWHIAFLFFSFEFVDLYVSSFVACFLFLIRWSFLVDMRCSIYPLMYIQTIYMLIMFMLYMYLYHMYAYVELYKFMLTYVVYVPFVICLPNLLLFFFTFSIFYCFTPRK